MQEDHPTDELVVTVAGELPAAIATVLRSSARALADRRSWVLGPPEFFDQSGPADPYALGLVLSVHTGRPPWGERLDRQVDRAQLEEVKELARELCRISHQHHASFLVRFCDEVIGTIEDGNMDDGLSIGLIGEWERTLDGSPG